MDRYGWFDYLQGFLIIKNYLTGQTLFTNSWSECNGVTLYHSCYIDDEISQSVEFSIFRHENKEITIKLDWNQPVFGALPYGRWRRVGDFLLDVLLCWPEFENLSRRFWVEIVGAWVNGVWDAGFSRRCSAPIIQRDERHPKYTIAEPYLMPLDVPTPQPWMLVDVKSPASKVQIKSEMLADFNMLYWPRNLPVEGFQGLVPYLERADKTAFIVFSELEPSTHRGEDPSVYMHYTYVDEDVFFIFRNYSGFSELDLSSCHNYGFREIPARRELWPIGLFGESVLNDDGAYCEQGVLSEFFHLPYAVWLRVLYALGEAWSVWGRPLRMVEIDKKIKLPPYYGRVGYVGENGPDVSYGFAGGLRNHSFEVRYPPFER